MGSIPIALERRHLTQDTYIRIRNPTDKYKIIHQNKRNIHPNNMVKKRSHQAVSKGCELEPEHSERFII